MKYPFHAAVLIAAVLTGTGAQAASSIAAGVTRTRIAGIDVIADRTAAKDVVIITGSLPAGEAFSPQGKPAIAMLTAAMLDKGTTKHDKFALGKLLEDAGASIEFDADNSTMSFSVHCLKEDLPMVVSLLAEQMRSPAFSAEEFDKLKKQAIGGIQQMMEDPGARSAESFHSAVYPQGHPNHTPSSDEQIAGISAAQVQDIKTFHAENYGPDHMTLVVAGDFDVQSLRPLIEKSFSGWSGGKAIPTAHSAAGFVNSGSEKTVFMPGKTSIAVKIGQATGLTYHDQDTLALRVATAVLGSGFTGRLMHYVRDNEGLTYAIAAKLSNDTYADGEWVIDATFAPDLLDKGIASVKRQLSEWYSQGVTADELAQRKTQLVGNYFVGMSTTAGLAGALLSTVQRGYDLAWLDEYPKAIQALTVAQVNGAIKKYLDPKKMLVIKAGTVGEAAKS